MIDIEGSSNNYRFQSSSNQLFKQHQDGDDEVLENSEDDSSSPSPSLIRHQQHSSTNPRQVTQIVPSERSSSNNPSSLNPLRLSKRTFDPSNSMAKSLLQDHRRSTTLTTDSTINNTSNINNFRGGGGDRPTSILDRVRAAWRQERERYLSIQDRSIGYSPIRLDGPNEVNQTLDENDNSRWPSSGLSSREMAMWRWINVEDLDAFLQEVYGYYKGKGIWAIGLSRLCNLLTVGFVIGFSTFLMGCIDYSILRSSHHLEEVIVPRCVTRFSGLTLILFLGCGGFYLWKVFSFSQEIAKLWQMHEFFTELLEVSEADIQTIPWHGLVDKISSLKHQHPSTTAAAESRTPNLNLQSTQSVLQRKLDAHDVANQIMREKNYLIALFNKDVLDLRPPLPKWMIGNAFIAEKTLTKSLEWNLAYCLRDYLLDGRGQVRPEFLQSELRAHLAAGLRRRFVMMAIINAALAPFLFLYVLMYSFFRYFEEYHKNPSSIGSRSFTRLAQWKFRGYNELSHLFQSRLIRSYSISKRYVDQFPKTKTSILAKFVSFVAGSFAAVLIVLSLFDPDAFLHFEVTRDRSVLFYIGLFGSILAISRGMTPKLYEEQIDSPEVLMQQIVQMTHYLPRHWAGRLHSLEVYNEFGELFQLKMAIFLQELMGVVLTPFTLWQGFSDEKCEKIVDFFREFTVHVEGIGYVCSFAVFDFNRLMGNESSSSRTNNPLINQTNRQGQSSASPFNQPQPRVQSQDVTKMERSLLNFVAHHPNWEPSNQTASLYLSKAIGYSAADSLFQPAHLQP
ncbi:autophagy protein Apg9-domain-containing protein, partial [Phakopsora pachyrhizi]